MIPLTAIILAAGAGKRMHSAIPKVMHPILGLPMVEWVMRACSFVSQPPVLVVGRDADMIDQSVQGARIAFQEEPLGSGHAAMMASEYIEGLSGYVFVLGGDMPLLTEATLRRLAEAASGKSAAIITTRLSSPDGYGRVVRNADGSVKKIVEDKDASDAEKEIHEVNVSAYCFEVATLLSCLGRLDKRNAQKEYYITDCISMLSGDVAIVEAPNDECIGVNNRVELAKCTSILQQRINHAHMLSGVTMLCPETILIDVGVSIESDTTLYPGTILQGNTSIGSGVTLYPPCRLKNCTVGSGAVLSGVVAVDAMIDEGAQVGPFAHLRPKAAVGMGCRVGNFVEIKNAVVGDGSKIPHLTYVGDGEIGSDSNIGCGVVFVNYDGSKKHRTVVGDGVFVGCNANLVAPVEVGDGAYIAAGSTITENVPPGALAIARERQLNKPGWVAKRKILDD